MFMQAEDLVAARAAAQAAQSELTSHMQLLSSLQSEKANLAQQLKRVSAEKNSLSEQLGSSAGDIDMLQVGILHVGSTPGCLLLQ